MPFKSKAQQRFMFANKDKLAKEGVDVHEWARDTDFSKLPEKKACWAIEYFKQAEWSHATKDRLFDVGGQLAGGIAGAAGAFGLAHHFAPDFSPLQNAAATGAGSILGSSLGRTVSLHAFGHRAPTTLAQGAFGVPDPVAAAHYNALPPNTIGHQVREKLKGLAPKTAGVEPSDLKHGTDPDEKFDPKELAKGVKIEHEHTDDKAVAKAITKAHLSEDRRYNTKLIAMEKNACWATEYFQMKLAVPIMVPGAAVPVLAAGLPALAGSLIGSISGGRAAARETFDRGRPNDEMIARSVDAEASEEHPWRHTYLPMLAGLAGTAAGAGLGALAGQEFGPDSPDAMPVGAIAGGVLGGAGTGYAAGRVGGRSAVNHFLAPPPERGGHKTVLVPLENGHLLHLTSIRD